VSYPDKRFLINSELVWLSGKIHGTQVSRDSRHVGRPVGVPPRGISPVKTIKSSFAFFFDIFGDWGSSVVMRRRTFCLMEQNA